MSHDGSSEAADNPILPTHKKRTNPDPNGVPQTYKNPQSVLGGEESIAPQDAIQAIQDSSSRTVGAELDTVPRGIEGEIATASL
jgi:hypothetical protein